MTNEFKNIKTGVIGVGAMGQNHARLYNDISTLVGVADPDEEQGKKVADRFGVKWFANYEEMISDLDAVTVSVPTFLHRKVAEKVSDAGVHMLIEKPLSDNIEDANYIVKKAHEKGICLAVGHIERFNPVISHLKRGILENKWGNLISLSSRRLSNYPHRIRDVGVIFDLAVHDLDIIDYLVNSKLISIKAIGRNNNAMAEHEDHTHIIMKYESGILGSCETSWLNPTKIRELNLTFSKAYVTVDYSNQEIEVLSSDLSVDNSNLYKVGQNIVSERIKISKEEPLKLELLNFLSSIISKEKVLVTGVQGLKIVKYAHLALNDILEGKN